MITQNSVSQRARPRLAAAPRLLSMPPAGRRSACSLHRNLPFLFRNTSRAVFLANQ